MIGDLGAPVAASFNRLYRKNKTSHGGKVRVNEYCGGVNGRGVTLEEILDTHLESFFTSYTAERAIKDEAFFPKVRRIRQTSRVKLVLVLRTKTHPAARTQDDLRVSILTQRTPLITVSLG
jgi:hypothetical protein